MHITNPVGLRALAVGLGLSLGSAFAATSGNAVVPLTPARMDQLSRSATATRADCLAAVGAYVFGRDAARHNATLVHDLQARGIVRAREAERPGRTATRGYAALLFRRALGEDGGVFTRVFKSSERYAYLHLTYLGLIPAGGSWSAITGLELVSLVSLSRKYAREAHLAAVVK